MSLGSNVISQDSNPVLVGDVTGRHAAKPSQRLRVLFVIEGYSDIRFITGLSDICDLTLLMPARQYRESGLRDRVLQSGVSVQIDELEGGRLRYQIDSLRYLLKNVRNFDVILSQEVLRGSFNSCLVGRLYGTPVVTYMNIPPLEYFSCRRERRQLGWMKAALGAGLIRALSWTSAKLATRCVAVGPYLAEVASRHCSRVSMGYAYGVDTAFFSPAPDSDQTRLRLKLNLPADKFLVLSGSRVSHEKDPETVLRAVSLARAQGLDAVVLNLGGGFQDFVRLAKDLSLPEAGQWVLGRPAAHPMTELADYYCAADVLAQASLDEGAGMTTLEALACGIPVVCTAVGGMARILPGYARLTPKQDAEAMAQEFLWISKHPAQAQAQAMLGREFVCREWSRKRAFASLKAVLEQEVQEHS
jgi:glycosyltransferase involved in cell wall biosynthesis